MTILNIAGEWRRKRVAILLLAAALAALPVLGSHTCKPGTDDYNQCLAAPHSDGSGKPDPTNALWYTG